MTRPPGRPRSRGVRLTARDLTIFEELLERRVETLGTLHARHWTGWKDVSARNRLGTLVAWGYLQRRSIEHPPSTLVHPSERDREWVSVYSPTPKAIDALRRRSIAASLMRGRNLRTELAEPAIADATYTAHPDAHGRTLVMLEVDLGHYSRQRILGKTRTFLANPDAKAILFACPTDQRAAWIANTLRQEHGETIMDRVQVLTFERLARGGLLRDQLTPDPTPGGYHDGLRRLGDAS